MKINSGPSQVSPSNDALKPTVLYFPNPFSDKVIIQLKLPSNDFVDIVIYDALGRKVADLSGNMIAGINLVTWKIPNEGRFSNDGIFYLIIRSDLLTDSRKLVYLK